jgi:hypothetical protein
MQYWLVITVTDPDIVPGFFWESECLFLVESVNGKLCGFSEDCENPGDGKL